MASAALALEGNKRAVIARGWIINQKDDLIWFIGSVVASYALLFANIQLGVPAMILVWIWALGFDGPHVAGTVSRTYADKEERANRARLLYGSFLLFALGPAMVLAGRAQLLGTAAWGAAFFFFARLWAYYHLVKQHYGFMILYKKKNNDLADIDNVIDRAFLLLGMTYPFLHFMSHGKGAAQLIPFSTQSGPFLWLENLVLFAFVISLIAFAGRQVHRAFVREPLDMPKMLLLAAAMPMHWIVLMMLEQQTNPTEAALAAVSILTIYHNLQYHRIVWFHNRNKYSSGNASDYGLASRINKSVWRYIVFALVFGAAYHIPHYTVMSPDGLVMGFFWGGAFTHYYLDSKIWRVRRDAKLNRNLRMGDGDAIGAG